MGNSRRADLGPLLALFGLVLAVFAGVVFGGRVFFERDVGLMWHGQADALARVVRAGSWPTWNPYHSFGVPLLANPNAQVFYPLTWLSLVMRPESYYSLYVVLHVLLSAIGALPARPPVRAVESRRIRRRRRVDSLGAVALPRPAVEPLGGCGLAAVDTARG